MQSWLERQAEMYDREFRQKKQKKDRENEEKMQKEKEEEEKRQRANEAFINWVKNKKKTSSYADFRGKKTDGKKTVMSSSTIRKNKIPLGPYTGVKELKQIQMELLADELNQQQTKHEPTDSYEHEMEQQYTKEEGIEDSLQELSSIKKDTPPQEQEADYD
jgi:hypothetical protein